MTFPGSESMAGEVRTKVLNVLFEHVVRDCLDRINDPHVVICRDRETGVTDYLGPYPDGQSALRAADRETRIDQIGGSHWEFSVAALIPVIDEAE